MERDMERMHEDIAKMERELKRIWSLKCANSKE